MNKSTIKRDTTVNNQSRPSETTRPSRAAQMDQQFHDQFMAQVRARGEMQSGLGRLAQETAARMQAARTAAAPVQNTLRAANPLAAAAQNMLPSLQQNVERAQAALSSAREADTTYSQAYNRLMSEAKQAGLDSKSRSPLEVEAEKSAAAAKKKEFEGLLPIQPQGQGIQQYEPPQSQVDLGMPEAFSRLATGGVNINGIIQGINDRYSKPQEVPTASAYENWLEWQMSLGRKEGSPTVQLPGITVGELDLQGPVIPDDEEKKRQLIEQTNGMYGVFEQPDQSMESAEAPRAWKPTLPGLAWQAAQWEAKEAEQATEQAASTPAPSRPMPEDAWAEEEEEEAAEPRRTGDVLSAMQRRGIEPEYMAEAARQRAEEPEGEETESELDEQARAYIKAIADHDYSVIQNTPVEVVRRAQEIKMEEAGKTSSAEGKDRNKRPVSRTPRQLETIRRTGDILSAMQRRGIEPEFVEPSTRQPAQTLDEMANREREDAESAIASAVTGIREQLREAVEPQYNAWQEAAQRATEAYDRWEEIKKSATEGGAVFDAQGRPVRGADIQGAIAAAEAEYEQARQEAADLAAAYRKAMADAERNLDPDTKIEQAQAAYDMALMRLTGLVRGTRAYGDVDASGYTDQEIEYTGAWGTDIENERERQLAEEYLTDDQKKAMAYYRSIGHDDWADDYYKAIRQSLQQQREEDTQAAYEEFGRKYPILGSVASVPVRSLTGVAAGIQNLGSMITGEYDPYTAARTGLRGTGTVRVGAKERMLESGFAQKGRDLVGKLGLPEETVDNALTFIYDTGISVLGDSTFNAMVLPGGANLGVLGLTAFSDTVDDMITNKGADVSKAMALGVIAGAAEIVTEKMRLDDLTGLIGGNSDAAGIRLIRNMLSEAGEEGTSEIINVIADCLIMGDESDYEQKVAEYMGAGMDEEEARRKAIVDMVVQVAEAGAGGALGGFMGGTVEIARGQVQSAGEQRSVNKMAEDYGETVSGLFRGLYNRLRDSGAWVREVNQGAEESQETRVVDAQEYKRVFDTIFEAGQEGASFEEVQEQAPELVSLLTQSGAERVWKAGQQAAAEEAQAKQEQPQQQSAVAQLAQETADQQIAEARETVARTQETAAQARQAAQEAAEMPERPMARQTQTQAQEATESRQTAQQEQMSREERVERIRQQYMKDEYDPQQYRRTFDALYGLGGSGMSYEGAAQMARQSGLMREMDPAAAQAIWQAGRNEAIATVTPGVTRMYTRKLNWAEKRMVRLLDEVCKDYGLQIVLVDSLGGRANGMYQPGGRRIVVAADAMEGSIAQAGIHEMVHFIRSQDKAGYELLAKTVVDHLAAGSDVGYDLEEAIEQRKKDYAEQIRGMDEDEARDYVLEEIVAEATSSFLGDEQAVREFTRTHRGLAEKIRDFLRDFVKRIREITASYGMKSQHDEGMVMMTRSTEELTHLARLFDDALASADQKAREREAAGEQQLGEMRTAKYSEAEAQALTDTGVQTSADGDVAYLDQESLKLSLTSLKASDYWTARDKAAAALAKRMNVSIEAAQHYIDNLTSVAAIISSDRALYDYDAESTYTAVKKNQEYKYTIDFSTLCAKRLIYTGTFDAIQHELKDVVLTENDFIKLRQIMAERGDTVPCAFCYVESRRKDAAKYIDRFVQIYKEAQAKGEKMWLGPKGTPRYKAYATEDGFTPTVADFNTTDGVTNMIANHKGVWEAYSKYITALGVGKPRLVENMTDYRHELLEKFKSGSAVAAMNRRGGLRLQSYSDFQLLNLLDMMQVATDMARVGLKSQAYTKVPAFARIFGETGIKINLSLVAKGVDENGKLIFDDIEGMNSAEAFAIREKHSYNVGTILVSKDDATTEAALRDPRIDFVIPFHKSGWSQANLEALGIGDYGDYTDSQSERSLATGKVLSKQIYPSAYWDYNLTGDENAQRYLALCKEQGRMPKFPQFKDIPGYWKLLIDFKMYDNEGRGAPQLAVRPDFDMDEAMKALKEYDGGEKRLPVDWKVVRDFLEYFREEHENDAKPVEPGVKFSLNAASDGGDIIGEDGKVKMPIDIQIDQAEVQRIAQTAFSGAKKIADNGVDFLLNQKLEEAAAAIRRDTRSKMKTADLSKAMVSLIQEYAKNGATAEAFAETTKLARDIIDQSTRLDDSVRKQYEGIRKTLRETPISLTDTQKEETANYWGSYGDFRKLMQGTVRIANGGISLDAIWAQLAQQAPEFFPMDTNEAQMPELLATFREAMKPRYVNNYGMDTDAASADLALRIQGDILAALGASKQAKQMYGMRQQYREAYQGAKDEQIKETNRQRVAAFRGLAEELRKAKATGNTDAYKHRMEQYRRLVKQEGLAELIAEASSNRIMMQEQTAKNARARERVMKKAESLLSMIAKPTKAARVPTMLQQTVLDVLNALDLNGRGGRETMAGKVFADKLTAITDYYQKVLTAQSKGESAEGMDGQMMAICERNVAALKDAVAGIIGEGKVRISDLDYKGLRYMETLLSTVQHSIDTINTLWKNGRYESVSELAGSTMDELDSRKERTVRDNTFRGAVSNFLLRDMVDPETFGEIMGAAGKTVTDSLLKGENEKFGHVQEAAEYTQRAMKNAGVKGRDIGAWRGKKSVKTFTLASGQTAKLTGSMVMSLYLTAKRPQGLQHLLGNGMRIMTTKETGNQVRTLFLTPEDITAITSTLTEEQRAMADAMQKYLATDVAKWGNDVTQRMYLFDAFTEETYWPLTSDPNVLKTQEPTADRNLTALTSPGFMKPLNEYANNPVILQDAFDVYGRHISEMASYAGLAEPISDALAMLNYKRKNADGLVTGTVKESMERALGKSGISYLTTLIQDLNGARHGERSAMDTLLRNYKTAAVMGKIRVVIQQPTSIFRASMEMNPAYLAAATFRHVPKKYKAEMLEHSKLAWWKANGNYDTGMGRSMDQMLYGDTELGAREVLEKASSFGGLLDPGKADDWAWVRMWQAVKLETKRTRPDLTVGSDEYWQHVTERFEKIMDRTQVVDTVAHRSQLMRNPEKLVKIFTSFQAEPTKGYNLLLRAILQANRNPSGENIAKVARASAVYVLGAGVTALAKGLVDAFRYRDDDDDLWEYLTEGDFAQDYIYQILNNWIGDALPWRNMPLVGDALGVTVGNPLPEYLAKRATGQEAKFTLTPETYELPQLQGLADLLPAAKKVYNYLAEDNSKHLTPYGAVKPMLAAMSELFGLPINGMANTVETLGRIYDPRFLAAKMEYTTTKETYKSLYKAILSGDSKKEEKIRAELREGKYGITEKTSKAIDTGLAEILATEDDRVREAWEMIRDGRYSDSQALVREIAADGFTSDTVQKAVNRYEALQAAAAKEAYMQAMGAEDEAEAERIRREAVQAGYVTEDASKKWLPSGEDEELSATMVDQQALLAAMKNGRKADVSAAIKAARDAGRSDSTIAGWVRSEYKDQYMAYVQRGNTEQAKRLLATLSGLGLTNESGTNAFSDTTAMGWINEVYKPQYIALWQAGKYDEARALGRTLQALGLTKTIKAGEVNCFRDDYLKNWQKEAGK